jgi:arabinose-5-phosphate isomerase
MSHDSRQNKSAKLDALPDDEILLLGKRVLASEAAMLQALSLALDETFTHCIRMLMACEGRVILSGVGKSGHIGEKIAASLASLGTPAFFVHAVEAMHGDLGMFTPQDVVILLSHSGNTAELVHLIPHLQKINCKMIAITGNPESRMAKMVDIHLDTKVRSEADSRGLAPTTSALVTLAIGDALALTLADLKGFTHQDFFTLHPGGSLGVLGEKSRNVDGH